MHPIPQLSRLASGCCILALAASAAAQANATVTLTVGNMVYSQNALSATSNSYVDASMRALGSTGPDHLFSHWWWYRVSGDSQETAFRLDAAPNTPTRTVAAPTITTTWPDVAGRGLFSANLTNVLVSTGVDSGYLTSTMQITNTSATPLTISIFGYGDIDVNGSNVGNDCFGDDASHYVERPASLTAVGEFFGVDADSSLVTPWQTTTAGSLPFVLSNTTVDDLTGWSGSMTNADVNSCFQWTRTIAPNASESFTTVLSIMTCRPLESLYGTAGNGTSGAPTISASARAITTGVLPRSFDILLGNGLPASLSMSLTNFNQASLPVSGVTILVDPAGAATRFGLTDASGNDRRGFDLPASITLCGLNLNHQFFVLDAGSASGFASHTQGLAQTFGNW